MTEYVDAAHAQELDEFVRTQGNCQFMQTSLWGRVKRDWSWYGILRRDAAGRITGTMALLRHNIHALHTCLLYCPCGPVFSDGDAVTFHELVDAAKMLAKRLGAYLLRIDPRVSAQDDAFAEAVKREGFAVNAATDFSLFQPRMAYVLDLTGMTPETLAAQYHRSTRYNIHHAVRNGITVRRGSAEDLPQFCRMMEQVAEKNGFTPRGEAYFRAMLEEMPQNARLYLAQYEGKTVAGAIFVFFGGQASFMYGCSDTENRAEHPNELIQFAAQCDALAQGCTVFDFRGVEGYPTPDNPKFGLHRYKAGFGARFCEYIGQCDLVLRPAMYRLVSLAQKLRRSSGTPQKAPAQQAEGQTVLQHYST